jgi:beta-glucosidase
MNESSEFVARLSLEEKASLTSGADFWTTKGVPGLASIMLTDGPHGVRKQNAASDHLGLADSVPATCFPPAVTLGSTFDPEFLERVGVALGEEALAENVGVLLGPGINIKRSPLCGRNFEYLSEDPILSGILGSALVRGLQSQGVGASLKHFAANNQETDRMRVSADIDPRPLREIYLRGFQKVVETAQPWTVMCSYNQINGVYSSQNPWLLTTVLRQEWGFSGLVVSDWGAVRERVPALSAGLDLQMPSSGGTTDAELVAAVRSGALEESTLDTAVTRIVSITQRVLAGAKADAGYDEEAHHALAREAAGRGIVLLKNDDAILPLEPATRVAVIGEFARTPRYQGAGSSQINPTRLDDALEAIQAVGDDVVFAAGFTIDGAAIDGAAADAAKLRDEAVAAARAAEVAVVFLGLPSADESEGYDREHIDLPSVQLELLEAVVEANSRVVVVLANGSVVALPFAGRVPAIVEGWLGGQAGGLAVADVLYGSVNPSGRLAETIPLRIEGTPAHLDFPGEHGHVRYGEGLFVGYRWFDARDAVVAFPFGHGLSYTEFAYSKLAVRAEESGLVVTVTVKNVGDRAGREVVQVYSGLPGSAVVRAPRELKAFASVLLEAGESREVPLEIPRQDLAYWETRLDSWIVESGSYEIAVGASSRDLRLTGSVDVVGDPLPIPLTVDSTIAEVMQNPRAAAILQEAFSAQGGFLQDDTMLKMMLETPVGALAKFPGTGISAADVAQLLAMANGA